jgi:glucuronate isomerase
MPCQVAPNRIKPMKPFLNADFLLPDDCSRRLFHDYAAAMPIIDYHCHLAARRHRQQRRFQEHGPRLAGW